MMSKEGLKLQVGDSALTDYRRGTTRVRIIERIEGTKTQSGVCFRVVPPLDLNHPEAMFDSDWFEPVQSVPSLECNPNDLCAGCRCAFRYVGGKS